MIRESHSGKEKPAGEQWRAGIGRDSRLASAEGNDFDEMVMGDWLKED